MTERLAGRAEYRARAELAAKAGWARYRGAPLIVAERMLGANQSLFIKQRLKHPCRAAAMPD